MPGGTQEAAMADTTDNQTQDEWNEETVYGPCLLYTSLCDACTGGPYARYDGQTSILHNVGSCAERVQR